MNKSVRIITLLGVVLLFFVAFSALSALALPLPVAPDRPGPIGAVATPTPALPSGNSPSVPNAPRLGLPPDPDCSDGQCVFYITASADDAGENSCNYSITDDNLYFGQCTTNAYSTTTGFIFRNVTLPQHAQIEQAYLEYTADGPYEIEDIQSVYYGAKSTNPAPFSMTNRPKYRVTAAALVNFAAPIPWHVRRGNVWEWKAIRTSPDLTPIVQAIVNQNEWGSSNDNRGISIIATTGGPVTGTWKHRRVCGFDRDPLNAPRLVIRLKGSTTMPAFTPNATGTLRLLGNAQIYTPELALRLTSASNQVGSAWYLVPQPATDRFEAVFDFRLPGKVGQGGDGFAFVMHYGRHGPYEIKTGGCDLGYSGMVNTVAVEFDTAATSSGCANLGDPNGNHISVQTGYTSTVTAGITHSLAMVTPTITLADGQVHTARINYLYNRTQHTGTLKIYLDQGAVPVLSVPLILSETLDLDSGVVWVGFTSGSSSSYEIHDIMNSYVTHDWDLNCLEYDFTSSDDHGFAKEIGSPASVQNGRGWRTSWTGSPQPYPVGGLAFQRGLGSSTLPLFQNDDFDPALVALVQDPTKPQPIKQVRVEYTWSTPPNEVPTQLPVGSTLNMSIELKSQNQITHLVEKTLTPNELHTANGWLMSKFDLEDVIHPAGLRLKLQLQTTTQVIYVKKVGFCFAGDAPPRPPIVPPGARAACQNLLTNLQTRYQPFGSPADTARQPEIQFPADVTLEPYPDYSLNADEYPASLTFASTNSALIPCVFKRNGTFYDPDSGSTVPAKPIVRFAATGADANQREQMTLLNYAGYFSVGAERWCYPRDDVFGWWNSRYTPTAYGTGYNVPAPNFDCSQTELDDNNILHIGKDMHSNKGPCGTFIGSLYRAMGYFNVDAFAQPFQNTSLRESVMGVIGGLYYAVTPYQGHLAHNSYWPVNELIVRTDITASTYVTRSVSFAAVRVYSLDSCDIQGTQPGFCQSGKYIYGVDRNDPNTMGNWTKPITVALSPVRSNWPAQYNPIGIWQAIKPGDLAITIIESSDHNREYTHIQAVVGWGPLPGSTHYSTGGRNTRTGDHFYATYNDLPSGEQANYVPYVMDRYQLRGTGSTTGPRPFHYGLSSTSTEFWVVDYDPARALKPSVVIAPSTSSRPAQPDRVHADPVSPAPLIVPGSVAWSPAGNQIALGNQFGIALYTPSMTRTTLLPLATSTVVALAWNPDSTKLASAEAAQQVSIWNVATGKRLATLTGFLSQLTSVAWSPDGSQIAAGSKDGTIRIYQTNTYTLVKTLPYTGTGYINTLAWSPTGDRLAASDLTAIYVWNMNTGQLATSFAIDWPSRSLAWTANGQYLITAGPQRWDVTTGQAVQQYPGCSSGSDTFASLSPDGLKIAGVGSAATGSAVCINQLDSQYQPVGQTPLQLYSKIDPLGLPAWSPNSQRVAFATQNGWFYLSEVASGTLQAVAPRLTTSPAELEALVSQCVTDDAQQLRLAYLLTSGGYVTFTTELQSQPTNIVDALCKQQLTKTAEFLMNNALLPPPTATTPQPLSLQYACSSNSSEWAWRVRNPNSYDVSVVWGWEDQWPTQSSFPFVVPAAQGNRPGEWLITTPAQAAARTLKILSSGFTATAQSRTYCSDIWLPITLKGSLP